jgi:hypothetical protein
MTKDEALRLALEAMKVSNSAWKSLADSGDAGFWKAEKQGYYQLNEQAIKAVEAALEAKDEPYALEASMYSNDRMKVDVVTGNVSIGTVKKPCGLECDCTDVCKQDDYKALWQQMCERCDELDKKLAQRKPLTDEEIKSQWSVFWEADCHPWAIDFARAIEAAHGIKGEA